jgi:hypothetical protein
MNVSKRLGSWVAGISALVSMSSTAFAAGEKVYCYLGVGSNSAPSCDAQPKALDMTAGTAGAYEVPGLRLEIYPSAEIAGSYDTLLASTDPQGAPLTYLSTYLSSPDLVLELGSSDKPVSQTLETVEAGLYNIELQADGVSTFRLRSFRGMVPLTPNENGRDELIVQIGALRALVCVPGTPEIEAGWADWVAHFNENCVK